MKLKRAGEPISREIVDRASEWFVEFRLGDADAQARERFNAWLRASPLHIRAYLEVAGAYAGLAPQGEELTVDIEQLIGGADVGTNVIPLGAERQANKRPAAPAVRRTGLRRMPFALAAGALLAIIGMFIWNRQVGEVYATQIGEQRYLALPDGSQLNLNARTRVRVRFDRDQRRIDLLAGQVLFQVAQDVHRPFVVHIENTVIRALGTQFDVARRATGTIVTVLEGRVAVIPNFRSSQSPPVLTAGDQLKVVPDDKALPKTKKTDTSAATAWMQRRLVFEGTPLIDVVAEFNRYNDRQLIIKDRSLEGMRVSGMYASTDPASLLTFLRTERNIAIDETAEEVLILSR